MNKARDHPERKFYCIEPQDDGTVDVYLAPALQVYETDIGIREYDISVKVVRGVEPWPGLEDDVRARYEAWCESGEGINL